MIYWCNINKRMVLLLLLFVQNIFLFKSKSFVWAVFYSKKSKTISFKPVFKHPGDRVDRIFNVRVRRNIYRDIGILRVKR